MNAVIYGIDPDSSKHGIAIYRVVDGKYRLCELLNLNTIQLYIHLTTNEKDALDCGAVQFHMENPQGNSSSAFNYTNKDTERVKAKKSESVGRVKQAQESLTQLADELNIEVIKYSNSSCWKKGNEAKMFARVTGWKKKSNEETRSAAYFGFMGTSVNSTRTNYESRYSKY